MKQILSIFLILFTTISCYAQTCIIKGTVKDKDSRKSIPFANIILLKNDSTVVASTTSDFDGKYVFNNLKPGTYMIRVYFIGYSDATIEGVSVYSNKISVVDVKMEVPELQLMECIEISEDMEDRPAMKLRSPGRMRRARFDVEDFNREAYSKIDDNEYRAVKKNPLSTFSIDVDRASYSNVRRHINEGHLPPADAVRIEEMINYFNYDYPQPKRDDPFSITTEYADCPWNKKHKLVQIGIQGKEVIMDKAPANNFVFLIDVSGSMAASNKLDLLKRGMYLLVDQLREEDKVSIVVYAGAAGLVLPATSGGEKGKIKLAIGQLSAGGSTAGGAGINLAYKVAKENFMADGNNRVILATDGDFNVGISSDGELIRLIEKKREDDIFLSVLGFGTGNLQDSKMEQIADKGNGNYNYIDNILEAQKVLVKELGGTMVTIAKDVKVQAEFNPNYVKAYRLIGYVNRNLNDEDFNDDKKDAGELGSGHTVTVLYEIIPADSKEEIADVDPLKYQTESTTKISDKFNNEVLTVKFRYKEPKGISSKLITRVLYDDKKSLNESSENLRFTASVAAFGMILRNSKFKGDADYKSVIELARGAKGKDKEGYRAEFIRLVEMAELLK